MGRWTFGSAALLFARDGRFPCRASQSAANASLMATRPAIDDATAEAIRQALAAASAGRITHACEIGERALVQGGDAAALNAMLGMLRLRSGDGARAVTHLRVAHRERPKDHRVTANLGSALMQLGLLEDALDVVSEEQANSDPSLQLLRLRGFIAQSSEKFDLAVKAYERVVTVDTGDWETWNNLGNARRAAGDFDGSVIALKRAAEINPASAAVQLNLGTALSAAGDIEQAEQQFRAMAERFPDDANPLRELHALYRQQARDEEALAAIEAAVARDPNDLDLRLALASHRLAMLQHESAEAAYLEVVKRDPANPLGNLGLAVTFELTNRVEQLSRLVDEAAARGVGPDAMNFIKAFDHRRAKRFDEGLEALARVPLEMETARRAHLLGQLEEGAGHYDAAFAAYERMNEIQRADESQPEERAAAYRENVRRQVEKLTSEWAARWKTAPVDERSAPAFLVGFPRSGTTLLDTFLMGHPGVEVLEEEPMLRRAHAYLPDFDALPNPDPDALRAARDAYFEAAAERTPLAPGSLLVDKNPLAMNGLSLVHRMFPGAKIVLALRHPCDVVLSCFVTNFKLNDGMSNFLRLETAAELYDLSFTYLERAREILQLPVHTVTYEKLVEDRDSELRPLFDFLGLDWHDGVLDHQGTAFKRGHIKTASYAQVVEPIYKRSAGRWQNYRKHLEPIIPVLKPWIDKFGYEV